MSKFKYFFFLSFSIFWFTSLAQEQNNLPFYTPPSPNAYEFGKFGQIPVGLFTGTPMFNLPLYEYKAGNLTVPISITYSSNGIKVDEIESKIGLGWVLNVGGVITRIVRDLPDEEYTSFYPEEEIEEDGTGSPSAVDFFYIAGNNDDIDSETDLFAFNFLGRSGKFVYDNNKKIIQMPHSDMKIEPFADIEGNEGYTITTSDGIKYIFSKTETTKSEAYPNGHQDPAFPITAWYLTKIVHPYGDEVNFLYEDEELMYTSSISQTVEILSPTLQYDDCGNLLSHPPFWRSFQNRSHVQGVRLKEISSSVPEYGKVVFNLIPPPSQIGIAGNRLVNYISVENKSLEIVDRFDFDYYYLANSGRILLNKITFKDPTKFYSFDYIDLSSLSPRLSYKQDHWGYYNGATGNTCLVPKNTGDYEFSLFDIGANREPNWNFSKKGLLSQITLPTKGTIDLEYESNSFFDQKINYPPKIPLFIEVIVGEDGGFGEQGAVSETIHSAKDQTIDITVRVEFNDHDCDQSLYVQHKTRSTLTIRDNSTNQLVDFYILSITGQKVPVTNVFTDNPQVSHCKADLLANHDYTVTLTPHWHCMYTTCSFEYYNQPSYITWENIETGGSRIKAITSHDPTQSTNEITRYYYGPIGNLNESSGEPGKPAYYITLQDRNIECQAMYGTWFGYETVKILSSSSLTPLFNTGNNNIYYQYVTVSHGGDNFENGGEEHEFIINRDIKGRCLSYSEQEVGGAPWTNIGWNNSLERRNTIFRKSVSGSLLKVKETINSYIADQRIYNESKGYSVVKRYDDVWGSPPSYTCKPEDIIKTYTNVYCGNNSHKHVYYASLIAGDWICINPLNGGPDMQTQTINHRCVGHAAWEVITMPEKIANLDIMEYKNISFWDYLESTTTKQYDENGENPITSIVKYFYDNPEHVQLTRTEKVASTSEETKQIFKYPPDVEQTSIMQSLIDQYRIGEIIENQKEVKSIGAPSWALVSTSKKHYKDWGGGFIHPDYFETSIYNNSPEIRERYHNIDLDNGNPLEYSKEDDFHESIIWGYGKTQPVIKGENVTYSDLLNATNQTNSNLEQLLSISGIGDLTTQSQRDQWKDFNTTLRSNVMLQNALITTYTYKSLVGITSETDPAGVTTYYEYDDYGRLLCVRNNDYNIVTKYEYHYKGN